GSQLLPENVTCEFIQAFKGIWFYSILVPQEAYRFSINELLRRVTSGRILHSEYKVCNLGYPKTTCLLQEQSHSCGEHKASTPAFAPVSHGSVISAI
ncbi:hypothetical protein U1499_10175, partial [Aeromonas caviae]|uniref:hypothetical protein n=1 Tax=Aeromonas caviae TaxID=648 RepID=UPI00301429FC